MQYNVGDKWRAAQGGPVITVTGEKWSYQPTTRSIVLADGAGHEQTLLAEVIDKLVADGKIVRTEA